MTETRAFLARWWCEGAAWLARPSDIGPLIVLRIAFGLLMGVSTARFMVKGWVTEFYVTPQFHFTYWGVGWVRPLPEWGLWLCLRFYCY